LSSGHGGEGNRIWVFLRPLAPVFCSYLQLQSIYIVVTVKLYWSYCDFGLISNWIWCY
jgi:hypothetical protein